MSLLTVNENGAMIMYSIADGIENVCEESVSVSIAMVTELLPQCLQRYPRQLVAVWLQGRFLAAVQLHGEAQCPLQAARERSSQAIPTTLDQHLLFTSVSLSAVTS